MRVIRRAGRAGTSSEPDPEPDPEPKFGNYRVRAASPSREPESWAQAVSTRREPKRRLAESVHLVSSLIQPTSEGQDFLLTITGLESLSTYFQEKKRKVTKPGLDVI